MPNIEVSKGVVERCFLVHKDGGYTLTLLLKDANKVLHADIGGIMVKGGVLDSDVALMMVGDEISFTHFTVLGTLKIGELINHTLANRLLG